MKICLYLHGLSHASKELYRELRAKGIPAVVRDCLCKEKEFLGGLEEIALVHVDTNLHENCLSKVKEIIQNNSTTKFYVIALGKQDEIINAIGQGQYPNLVYIKKDNAKEAIEEMLNSVKLIKKDSFAYSNVHVP